MGKVVLAMFISLDGFIEAIGEDGKRRLIPPAYSADVDRYWIKPNTSGAVMMYGRVCYEGMAAYWTSPAATPAEAKTLAAMRKIVFSHSLQKADWANTEIVRDDIAGAVAALKAETDGDLILIGGAGIANAFMRLDLIDEYRLLVTPMLFGSGTPLFQGERGLTRLALQDATRLDNGAMLLTYTRGGA
jgi:dihydrofolate reductase